MEESCDTLQLTIMCTDDTWV